MRLQASRRALRITLIYIGVAVIWIPITDELVQWLVGDPGLRAGISLVKNWAFVPASGGLLFLLLRGLMRGWQRGLTGQRIAAKASLESEACYRQLFELESDAILLLDCDTHRFVDVNESAQLLYGYSRAEFLKMTEEGVSDEPEPPRAKAASGSQFVPLRWHRKKSGERFAVEISSKVFSCQGRRLKLATVRDTTARQQVMDLLEQAAGQLTAAQHHAGAGSYVMDFNGACKN
jgi:PAS domain S-box-containing protein